MPFSFRFQPEAKLRARAGNASCIDLHEGAEPEAEAELEAGVLRREARRRRV